MFRLHRYLSLIALACVLAACSNERTETAADVSANNKNFASLVLIGGTIAIVDPAISNVEALAV